jgi:putative transposase
MHCPMGEERVWQRRTHQSFPRSYWINYCQGAIQRQPLDSSCLIGDMKKALAERILNTEMDVRLVKAAEAGIPNHRNGGSDKTVLTRRGDGAVDLPRSTWPLRSCADVVTH